MSRSYCLRCTKPESACLCAFLVKQENSLPVLVLQHEDEISHAVGTAKLITLSLSKSILVTGTVFPEKQIRDKLLALGANKPLLVYPVSQNDKGDHYVYDFEKLRFIDSPLNKPYDSLILLDGTWRNTREIWYLNPWLKNIASLSFQNPPKTSYRIRQAKKPGALATIEAATLGLRLLGETLDEKALLRPFEKMIEYQIEKMGEATYNANYLNKTVSPK